MNNQQRNQNKKCIHDKRQSTCELCGNKPYVGKKCTHGKRPAYCDKGECVGTPYVQKNKNKKCIHEKRQSTCELCGNKPYVEKRCEHGKRPAYCDKDECVGHPKPFVQNDKRKKCIHGKRPAYCDKGECIGKPYVQKNKKPPIKCEHNKRARDCYECGGNGICEHKRIRSRCKDCHGGSRCREHNNIRTTCGLGDCRKTATGICEHDKTRTRCKDCNGGNLCEHKLQRSQCRLCEGSSLCSHGRFKHQCFECPLGDTIRKSFCQICVSKILPMNKRGIGICGSCDTETPQRIEHTFGNMIIDIVGFPPNSKDKAIAVGANCKGLDRRRPDLLWVIENKVAVVVEIDEDSHRNNYESSCEIRKISEQNLAIQQIVDCENIPVHTIRVNPNEYDVIDIPLETRAKTVGEKVNEILKLDSHESNGYAKLYFYCYHSKAGHMIDAQRKHWTVEIMNVLKIKSS